MTRNRCASLALAILAPLTAAATIPAAIAPGDPVPIAVAAGDQVNPALATDGKGGALIAWSDGGHGGYDIHARHLLPSGAIDRRWPAIGVVVCDAPGDQAAPAIAADGKGGAIVAWYDQRNGVDHDVYAAHLLASGRLDPAWPKEGVALCVAPHHQQAPAMVADGHGGAIVTWFDYRDSADAHIYAQRVLASGRVDPRWPVNGVALCRAAGSQYFPKPVADGAGGAIVAWYDHRGADYDVYVQRVSEAGVVDSAWPKDGCALSTALGDQRNPVLVADGKGGAIVAWDDARAQDVVAQHVSAAGALDPAWPAGGLAVCDAPGRQRQVTLVPDGAGGAVAAWADARAGNADIYAQHLLATGSPDPRWPANGLALCVAESEQEIPAAAADGAGGAIVAWQDARGGAGYDLYAQRVLASGVVDSAWTPEGVALSIAPGDQVNPAVLAVGRGAAIVTWEDRGGVGSDLYAARCPRRATSGTRRTASPGSGR